MGGGKGGLSAAEALERSPPLRPPCRTTAEAAEGWRQMGDDPACGRGGRKERRNGGWEMTRPAGGEVEGSGGMGDGRWGGGRLARLG